MGMGVGGKRRDCSTAGPHAWTIRGLGQRLVTAAAAQRKKETETPKGVVKGSCIEQLTMTAILPLRAEENGGPKPAPKRAKQAKERTTKSKKPTTATTGLNKSRSAKGSS